MVPTSSLRAAMTVGSLSAAVLSCAPSGEAPTAFEGARIITSAGEGEAVFESGVMVVRAGAIEALGPTGSVDIPAGATRVDLSGKTVMPLLVNVHGHVGYLREGETGPEHYSRDNVLDHLRRSMYYGVGVVQSLGTDRNGVEIAIRDEQRAGALQDPELALLLTGGRGIVAPTPGSVNGGPFFATDVVLEAATPEEARVHVRTLADARPDMLKLWVDDRNGTRAKMTPDVYRAVIDEAHARGLRAVAHVYYLDDAMGLVDAGVDGFAHMVRAEPGVTDDLVDLIRDADIFQCSTLTIQKRLVDPPSWLDDPALAETVRPAVVSAWRRGVEEASSEAVARSREQYARLEGSLRRLHAGGARVVLCGDTGLSSQAPGFTEHRELEAMVLAGVPPLDALRAATAGGADVLGLPDRGALSPGKRADFLVLDANPLDDIANTRRIADVYSGGAAVDRAAMRARWLGSD